MRTIESVKKYITVGRLRCKRCGAKKTFYFHENNQRNAYWPRYTFNGWKLEGTELCPRCQMKEQDESY